MRRLRSSWTKVLTQLGFRHPRKQRKRTHIYRRSSRLESLEDRRLLAIDDWRKVLDVAPPSFAAGHFTLNSTDWSGKANGGRVMASGYALGIDSKGSDKDVGGFQPGEFWSFRFDQPGRLMGIHFDDFHLEDADKALLQIGDAAPITIDASRVKGDFWRPDHLIEFAAGQTLRLTAAEPAAGDLKRAEEAYEQRMSEFVETHIGPPRPFQPNSEWKVRGVNVIGLTDSTHGGYIDFAHIEPTNSVASAASLVEGYRPPPGGPLSGPSDAGITMGFGAVDPDVVLTNFEVNGTSYNQFKFTYQVNGIFGLSSFNIRVYRSADGVTPTGGALASYNVTGVATGTHTPTVNVDLGNDVQEDYYLLAMVEDAGDETENNEMVFAGGAFRDNTSGIAYYHAAKSETYDGILITSSLPRDIQRWQNGKYESIYQHPTDFTSVHVRTHGGNDSISANTTTGVTLWGLGGTGADNIYGGPEDDFLSGGFGLNTIYGGNGDDLIYGGDETADLGYGYGYGSDWLYGQAGNDSLFGQRGPDWISGDIGDDRIEGGDEDGTNGSYFYGYGDYLSGGNDNDTILGGEGGDLLYGNNGDDFLDGGLHNDTLEGGDNDDYLLAGDGNDTRQWRTWRRPDRRWRRKRLRKWQRRRGRLVRRRWPRCAAGRRG